jgi:hypothetical protein
MKGIPLLAIVIAAAAGLFLGLWLINPSMSQITPLATQMIDDTISVPGFLGRPSIETSIIDLKAKGTHFAIPRNYLESAAIQTNYGVFFRIVTTFPEFIGASAENLEQFRAPNWWRYPNTIVIAHTRGLDPNRNRHLLAGAVNGKLEDTGFGLELAKRYSYDDVFVNFDDHAAFQCEQKGVPDNGLTYPRRCREWVTVGNGVTFQCEFLRDQLKNWRAINDGIHKLLHRFVVEERAAAYGQSQPVKVRAE